MNRRCKKTTPTNEEVVIIKEIIEVFAENRVVYGQAIDLLPSIERALRHKSLMNIIDKA